MRHLPAQQPRGRPCGHPLRATLVDTLGLPISLSVMSANTHDKIGRSVAAPTAHEHSPPIPK
jgi:hypothetical protein